MLAHGTEISTIPYLWTAMFGKSIRYAGEGIPRAAVEIVLVEMPWDTEITATFICVPSGPASGSGLLSFLVHDRSK